MTEPRAPANSSHALCLTRGELVLCGLIFVVGVGASLAHELLFGSGGQGRLFSTTIDAIQGSLFWSAVLLGLGRLGGRGYRLVRSWATRGAA
jgi:membrane protease YdiL (CAAX protease family)